MNLPMLTRGRGREATDDSEKDESAERAYLREAYSASKEGDEKGFIEAMSSAIRACVKSYGKREEEEEAPPESEG